MSRNVKPYSSLLLVVFLLWASVLGAQPGLPAESLLPNNSAVERAAWPEAIILMPDSIGRVLGPDAFLGWVASTHPLARQGGLLQDAARARLLEARGGFDPKLAGGFQSKRYDDKEYWDLGGADLKIPTWLGLAVKADYRYAQGEFLNSERSVPADGQFGLGLSANLLRDLVTDRRRTDLAQARAFGDQAAAERDRLMADLFLAAAEAYWQWSASRARLELALLIRNLADQRLNITIAQFTAGNRAAIDTLEARINRDKREAQLIEAALALQNQRLLASSFLWNEDGNPTLLAEDVLPFRPDSVLPEALAIPALLSLEGRVATEHPDMRAGFAKQAQLDAERRYKVQQLLPRLEASYQWLSPASPFAEGFPDRVTNDYKWGLSLELPLFLRKERGALQAARIKVEQMQWELAQKGVNLEVKLRQAYNSLEANGRLLTLFDRVARDSRVLYEGERTRFRIGESSLFLVNSRESSYQDALIKLLETQTKQHILDAKMRWQFGDPNAW